MVYVQDVLRLLRVHHYIKNLLVFAALACSGDFFNEKKLLICLASFAAFCMASSFVYIVNDIRDRKHDSLHPTKCRRPIASGRISVPHAATLAAGVLLLAFLCSILFCGPGPTALLAAYIVLNIGYSFGLKDVPLADISILTAGFLLRVLCGAQAVDIVVSAWLYLTILTLSVYFSLGKRRNERKRAAASGETRRVLKYYTAEFLDKNMYMCLALANGFYALWCIDRGGISYHYDGKPLLFTVPIVLLITMRYSMDIEGDSEGDPVEVLIHDKALIVLCAFYGAVMFSLLYL